MGVEWALLRLYRLIRQDDMQLLKHVQLVLWGDFWSGDLPWVPSVSTSSSKNDLKG